MLGDALRWMVGNKCGATMTSGTIVWTQPLGDASEPLGGACALGDTGYSSSKAGRRPRVLNEAVGHQARVFTSAEMLGDTR
ncbi:unnamed protein product [Ilex paraguariensis]|uniref:Uncharacterized protein n=1 Tax=Ilex paraguariensis TaxID=185542 RepID=A0ABC8SWY7_9AQUA